MDILAEYQIASHQFVAHTIDGFDDLLRKCLGNGELAVIGYRASGKTLLSELSKLFGVASCDQLKIMEHSPMAKFLPYIKEVKSLTETTHLNFSEFKYFNARLNRQITLDADAPAILEIKLRGLPFPIVYARFALQSELGDYVKDFFILLRKNVGVLLNFVQEYQDKEEEEVKILNCNNHSELRVAKMSWDDVIMSEQQKLLVRHDLEHFLVSHDWYKQRRLAYRRGYLFYGEPGNGKTTVLKAILNHVKAPAYMLSEYSKNAANAAFRDMFAMAAENKISVIILEDIDRLFGNGVDVDKETEHNLVGFSTLLNILDGAAEYEGVIVVATANNPKKLDNAILKRPGRFDRVVAFNNPSPELAAQYLSRLEPGLNYKSLLRMCTNCQTHSFAQWREIYILATQTSSDESGEVTLKNILSAERTLRGIESPQISPAIGYSLKSCGHAPYNEDN